jgi:chromosome segregation ATPase
MPDTTPVPAPAPTPPPTASQKEHKTVQSDNALPVVVSPKRSLLPIVLGVLCSVLLVTCVVMWRNTGARDKTIVQIQNRSDQLQAGAIVFQGRLNDADEARAVLQRQIDTSAATAIQTTADAAKAKAATDDLQIQLDKARLISTDFQMQMEDAKVSSIKHQGEVERAQTKTSVMQTQLTQATDDAVQLQAKLAESKTLAAALQEKLSKATDEVAALKKIPSRK